MYSKRRMDVIRHDDDEVGMSLDLHVNRRKMQVVFDAEKGIDDLCAPSEPSPPPDNFPLLLTQMYGRITRRFELYRQPLKIFYSLDDINAILGCVPQVIRRVNAPEYEPSHIEERVLLYSRTGRCLTEVPQHLLHHTGSPHALVKKQRGMPVWKAMPDFGKTVYGIVYLFFLFDDLIEFSLFVNLDGCSMKGILADYLEGNPC